MCIIRCKSLFRIKLNVIFHLRLWRLERFELADYVSDFSSFSNYDGVYNTLSGGGKSNGVSYGGGKS